MTGGRMLFVKLPSTRAIFAAKGCFSTNQDILFEIVSATRTDKIGKEWSSLVISRKTDRLLPAFLVASCQMQKEPPPPPCRTLRWLLVAKSRRGAVKSSLGLHKMRVSTSLLTVSEAGTACSNRAIRTSLTSFLCAFTARIARHESGH
jgi:hypothetical protein